MANGKKDTKTDTTDLSEVAALCAGDEAFVKSVLYPLDDSMSLTNGLLDANSTHTPAEIAIKVQARVADLEREVYLLKSHRNAVASNMPLPAELLAKVFCALEELYRGSTWKALEWVRVTHVCRHWRNVALECPALWCYISTQNRNRKSIGVMLERSQQAPLAVSFRNWRAEDDGTLLEIVAQMQRLQSLELERDVDGNSCLMLEKVLSKVSDSPKLLEKLAIVGPEPVDTSSSSDVLELIDVPVDTVPKELAQMDFPRLRILEISRCVIPWEVMPKARQLTQLKLHTLPRKEAMSAQSFVSSLQSLTKLQCLDLAGMLPSEDSPTGLSPIALPALRTLKLKGSTAQFLWFLRATRIPLQAKPYFAFAPDPKAEDAAQFLSALDDSWIYMPEGATTIAKPGISSKFQTFGISNVGEDDRAYGKEVKPPTLFWWSGPAAPAKAAKAQPNIDKARLSVSFAEQQGSSYEALRAFLDQLDFGSLRCLWIDTCPALDASMWDVFARLEKLATIIFRNGQTMHGFSEKIKDDPVDGAGSDRELSESSSDSDDGYSYSHKKPKKKEIVNKPYFPGLKYVRCYKVHFGELCDWGATAEVVSNVVDGFGRRPDPKYSYLTMEVVDCINFSREDDDFMAENTDVNVDYDGKYSLDDPNGRRRRSYW